MAKEKEKESPVETPINTPINTPERPPITNSFSALQSKSDGEEEKSIDTINAEEDQLEIKSKTSEDHEMSMERQPSTPPTTSITFTNTPDELKQSSAAADPIAEILPTDLERLKESVLILALQLTKTVGKLFPDEPRQNDQDAFEAPRNLKPPPEASLPVGVVISRIPDKFANSPYFNSWKGPKEHALIDDDSKPPAVMQITALRAPPKSSPRIQADLIAEHQAIQKLKALKAFGNWDGQDIKQMRPGSGSEATEEDRALAKQIFGGEAQSMDVDPPNTSSPQAPVFPKSVAKNTDVIDQINQSIERNRQSLFKLEDMLRAAKEAQVQTMDLELQLESVSIPSIQDIPVTTMTTELCKAGTIQTGTQRANQLNQSKHTITDGVTPSERDPFTELATQKPAYPKLLDPSPKRPFFYRATWRIYIPNDMESPVKGLVDGLSEIWAVLKSVDDKFIIYPWKQSNHGRYKALSGPPNFLARKKGSIGTSQTRISGPTPARCI
jgi:hypothetical protein